MDPSISRVAARTALGYGLVAGAWILLSDRLLASFSPAPATIHLLQTYKGGAFVVVTAVLLYATLRTQLQRSAEAAAGRDHAEEALRRDIEERKRTEERLRAALGDNLTLLREVHHRTKNNLQMLCDLLYLQLQAIEHPEEHDDLRDAYARVYVLARLHDQLYHSMQSGRIALGAYLGRLLEGLAQDYPGVTVRLDAPRDGLELDLDRALRVGLITNELVTKSTGASAELLRLQVGDNGRGLPPGLHLERPKTVGLRIVQVLTRGLQARMTVENSGGCTVTLTLPLQAEVARDPG
jgi:two-component sensor histidine kinase